MTKCQFASVHFKLAELRRDAKYSDVSILVGGKTFECHRIILAAASSYFDTMFSGNFKENSMKELRLYDVDPEIFEEVLKSIYEADLHITKDNVFNLLRITEFLSVQIIRDSCIEFILENMYSIENMMEIFVWASTMNISPLLQPLLKYISDNFLRFSESTAFLEMPFDELRAVLTRRFTQPPLIFEVDDLFVDMLLRWLHYSFDERKDHFEILGAMIPLESISVEYAEFLERNCRLNLPASEKEDNLKKESFFRTYITCYDGCFSNHDLPPASFADCQFSANNSSIHLYSEKKIFSINKYKPDGYISHVKQDYNPMFTTLISSNESKFLYSLEFEGTAELLFRAYSSIDLSESKSRYLCPPPIESIFTSAFDGKSNSIYLATRANSSPSVRNRNYSSSKAFSNEEIKRGIFHYNCELDEWFSVPQLKKRKDVNTRIIINNNLIYFIFDDGHVDAYDTRSFRHFILPRTNFHYSRNYVYGCCILNEKIYVGDGRQIEELDLTGGRNWRTIRKAEKSHQSEYADFFREYSHLLPYENMLWLFHDTTNGYYHNLFIHAYNPKTGGWLLPHNALSSERIVHECDLVSGQAERIRNIIVFKTN